MKFGDRSSSCFESFPFNSNWNIKISRYQNIWGIISSQFKPKNSLTLHCQKILIYLSLEIVSLRLLVKYRRYQNSCWEIVCLDLMVRYQNIKISKYTIVFSSTQNHVIGMGVSLCSIFSLANMQDLYVIQKLYTRIIHWTTVSFCSISDI